jgi:hypothetical protein
VKPAFALPPKSFSGRADVTSRAPPVVLRPNSFDGLQVEHLLIDAHREAVVDFVHVVADGRVLPGCNIRTALRPYANIRIGRGIEAVDAQGRHLAIQVGDFHDCVLRQEICAEGRHGDRNVLLPFFPAAGSDDDLFQAPGGRFHRSIRGRLCPDRPRTRQQRDADRSCNNPVCRVHAVDPPEG